MTERGMNNELRDKVIEILTDVCDRQAQICESADEIIEIVETALAQQQDLEPVAWISRVKCVGPEYGKERYGKMPVQSLNPLYYEHVPLYLHPPKPAAQPQVPEGYQLVPTTPTKAMMKAFWLAGPYPEKPFIPGYDAMLYAAKEQS